MQPYVSDFSVACDSGVSLLCASRRLCTSCSALAWRGTPLTLVIWCCVASVLVDLAGSERVGKTGITGGVRLEEAKKINRSLTTLGIVIKARPP
jgi:hypothetical protein